MYGRVLSSLHDDLGRGVTVRAASLELNTRTTYGSALLVLLVWAKLRGLEPASLLPCSTDVVVAWVLAMAGSYSEGTIGTYVSAYKAWHSIQGLPWLPDEAILRRSIDGCKAFAPPSSKREKREPYTIAMLHTIRSHLDLDDPLDAACWACCCIAFFSLARLGELTIKRGSFAPDIHATRAHLGHRQNSSGQGVSTLHIPKTKAAPIKGEDLVWHLQQDTASCPETAMQNHLRVNAGAADNDHIFAYRTPPPKATKKRRTVAGAVTVEALPLFTALTFDTFNTRIKKAAAAAKLKLPSAHAFRIGGTTEYLLRGMSVEVVRLLGRWASDAFKRYIRKHAEIMAPYLEEHDEVVTILTRCSVELPPVR
jgi:hypothetical protein